MRVFDALVVDFPTFIVDESPCASDGTAMVFDLEIVGESDFDFARDFCEGAT